MAVDEKFCKIPFDKIAKGSRASFFQKDKEWMRIFSIYVDFREKLELGLVRQSETFNLSFVSWFLSTKLIAWKCKNSQPLGSVC